MDTRSAQRQARFTALSVCAPELVRLWCAGLIGPDEKQWRGSKLWGSIFDAGWRGARSSPRRRRSSNLVLRGGPDLRPCGCPCHVAPSRKPSRPFSPPGLRLSIVGIEAEGAATISFSLVGEKRNQGLFKIWNEGMQPSKQIKAFVCARGCLENSRGSPRNTAVEGWNLRQHVGQPHQHEREANVLSLNGTRFLLEDLEGTMSLNLNLRVPLTQRR